MRRSCYCHDTFVLDLAAQRCIFFLLKPNVGSEVKQKKKDEIKRGNKRNVTSETRRSANEVEAIFTPRTQSNVGGVLRTVLQLRLVYCSAIYFYVFIWIIVGRYVQRLLNIFEKCSDTTCYCHECKFKFNSVLWPHSAFLCSFMFFCLGRTTADCVIMQLLVGSGVLQVLYLAIITTRCRCGQHIQQD